MLWQMSSLTVQIHVTRHFHSHPKYLTNCGYNWKIYWLFFLWSCFTSATSFLKCFWNMWFPLPFLWVQIQLCVANTMFLGGAMTFLLYCWLANLHFGILSVMTSSLCSPSSTSCAFFWKSKKKIPSFCRWEAKGIYKNQQLPNDMLQVGRLLL